MQPRLILVGGGCRSGKSGFALRRARSLGPSRVFLATGSAGDDEMRVRIERHRQARGPDFTTVEEPVAVADGVRRHSGCDVLVLDCLTLWLANLMLMDMAEDDILQRVDDLIAALAVGPRQAIVVTNEVGMGIVPETPLGRAFRDVAGSAHQRLSRAADEVYLAVLGTVLRLKPDIACMGEAHA